MPDLIIDDSTPEEITHDKRFGRGLIPRDLAIDPPTMFSPPSEIPLIPRSEWDARIDEQERTQSSLEHIWKRSGLQPLDQDGFGYCWTHSTTHAVMMVRAFNHLPNIPLSAFAVAATIKNFEDEGGWCGLSADFIRKRGVPSQEKWPQQSMKRSNDNPDTWADAALHKIEADYVDLTRPVWGQNLTFDQMITCLLMNIPCALDFNWQGHSVCGARAVRVEAGHWAPRILNSWYVGPGVPWGDKGFATYARSRGIPNGALGVRVISG